MNLSSILLTCLMSWLLAIIRCSAQNGEKCTLKTEVPAFVINDCTGRYIPPALQNPFSVTSVLAIELKPKQIHHQKFIIAWERRTDFKEARCSESFPGDNWNDYNFNDQSFVGETVPIREGHIDKEFKTYLYQTDVQLYQNLYCRIKLSNEIPHEPCRTAKLETQPDLPSHRIRVDHNCEIHLMLDGARHNDANKEFLKVYGHVCFTVATRGRVDCKTSVFDYSDQQYNTGDHWRCNRKDACSDTKVQSHGWGMAMVIEEEEMWVGTESVTLKYIAGLVPMGDDYSCQRVNPSYELRMGIPDLEIGANGPKTTVVFVSEDDLTVIIDGVERQINANQQTTLSIEETICIESEYGRYLFAGNIKFAVIPKMKSGRFDTGSGCYKCKTGGEYIQKGWCVPNRFLKDDQETLCKTGNNQISVNNQLKCGDIQQGTQGLHECTPLLTVISSLCNFSSNC
ncbi:hypothetical protein HELRODRAFT_172497 [Helobdella robusta]|uniref:Uncharacterized protein n=1 Tax=Helobdella robusta TaxID=6412 RepID=T1F5E8_HELRO|nr:hypothetical protein HELRODRAFT_172497 [Helobdella robusta]ESO04156.1 hypothetical protein HELRODRAFT_172497 [Helobdella robusta]